MQQQFACPQCHQYIYPGQPQCHTCGYQMYWQAPQPSISQSVPGRTTLMSQQTELSYYSDDRGVRVTTTRLIVGNATYAMANIASIKTYTKKANRIPAIITAVFGLIVLLIGLASRSTSSLIIGLVIMFIGMLWAVLLKPIHILYITSSSTETEVLVDKDLEYINQVVRAVNEALIHRG